MTPRKLNISIPFFWGLFLILLIFVLPVFSYAQCPNNIDFERGDFTGWECWTGETRTSSGTNIISLAKTNSPVTSRHVMFSSDPGDGLDPYGLFPVNCPNGSGHSIRLGNDGGGHQAEGISYTFTIPAGQNDFSIYFQYALVLQDFGHLSDQQPRFLVEVENLTDGGKLSCALAPFVPEGGLPGFKLSTTVPPGVAAVRYKDWAAASIKMDGYAGKTIRLFFKTADCVYEDHFGYAYIDIESDCSSKIFGSTFCPLDTYLDLLAPPGFAEYKWFNNSGIKLGTQQVLAFNRLPQSGDTVHVELTPFNGYGCTDTLTTYLWDTLSVVANAGPDREFCVNSKMQLGVPPKRGLKYSWSPTTGLSSPHVANPFVTPTLSIEYTLTVSSVGGGCVETDIVKLTKKCDVIEFYVPNAFSPNGDGVNDRLKPVLYGYSRVNYFRVYNRFGQLLYSANSDLPGWDGSFNGKPLATQTVVWIIEAVDAYNRKEKRQGTAVIIR